MDGSGTATELTYWTDSDTVGGITNFTSDGTNVTKFVAALTSGMTIDGEQELTIGATTPWAA